MALVDLKTDLKSLKFESGLNRKPFVVKDVDQKGGRNSAFDVIGIQAAKRLDDVIRMAKLVVAKPGLTHAAKQALQVALGAVETGKLYDNGNKDILKQAADILATAVTNTGQTAVNGLGIHLHKGVLELAGKKRQYLETVKNPRLKNAAHSNQISVGIKKSKKLTIADDQQYGKIDYLKKPDKSVSPHDNINFLEAPEEYSNEDIIKFGFTILPQKNTEEKQIIQFRAYLTAMSDSFSGAWNKTAMIGRPENFKSYQGFERNITLGFKVAADTRKDLLPLYRKLNLLASTTAPTFDEGTQLFMQGTLVRVKVGDYFDNQLCNVENVALSWAVDYPWEVKLQKDEKDVQVLPHVLDVSMTLGAIHEFVPQAMKDLTFFGYKGVKESDEKDAETIDGLFSKKGNDRDDDPNYQ